MTSHRQLNRTSHRNQPEWYMNLSISDCQDTSSIPRSHTPELPEIVCYMQDRNYVDFSLPPLLFFLSTSSTFVVPFTGHIKLISYILGMSAAAGSCLRFKRNRLQGNLMLYSISLFISISISNFIFLMRTDALTFCDLPAIWLSSGKININ